MGLRSAEFARLDVSWPPGLRPFFDPSIPLRPHGSEVRAVGISFSPGCRPAVDETCGTLCLLAAERLAVSLVRASPRISWTRGIRSTPDCAMGKARERVV